MTNTSRAYALAAIAILLSVGFTVSTLASAQRGNDDVRNDRSVSLSDDGTADQGRGDVGVPTSSLSDDGTPDQGRGDTSDGAAGTIPAGSAIEIEADIFTDITIVKMEIADEKIIFETATRDRATLVAEIAQRFDISAQTVEDVIVLEIEDRASRLKDRD